MLHLRNKQFSTDYLSVLELVNAIDPIKYAKTRNFLNGDITYLSPYISRGVISLKQILDSVINNGYSFKEAEKFIQELAWREYYQRVWQNKSSLIWSDLKYPQQDIVHHKMIAALQKAQTGIAIIDESISHFIKHGYLHNHLRMYIASIACNIAKAHWLEPSKWMYYHLLDGDIASNNCSWQWVAGVFSNKKYYCNQENINKYTFSNQAKTFLDQPYEALGTMSIPDSLIETVDFDLKTNLPKTDFPHINIQIPTLIYNSYNLDPEWRKGENVNRVLLLEPSHFNQYPVSDIVLQFIIGISKNIQGIQIYVGEIDEIQQLYSPFNDKKEKNIISKENPAFNYYPGIKEPRDWMFPYVKGFYLSFFSFWKKGQKSISFFI